MSSFELEMATVKDLMVEFFMELLKEEREKRKQMEKELAESNKLTTELIEKIHKLETDIILERHCRVTNQYRHGRVECDDGVDEVDTLDL